MKSKDKFSKTFKMLLSEKLPEEEVMALCEEGFNLKSPTRTTALAIALYKKAEKGDLAALKELLAITKSEGLEETENTVVIIDDIKKET